MYTLEFISYRLKPIFAVPISSDKHVLSYINACLRGVFNAIHAFYSIVVVT